MKYKLIKKSVCPKCGREYRGFYINPICLCGHHFRELNGWETSNLSCTEEEFNNLTTQEKRFLVRSIAWNKVDVKWHFRFLLPMFVALLAILGDWEGTENALSPVIKTVCLIVFLLCVLSIIVKTLYFQHLKRKDALFFANK